MKFRVLLFIFIQLSPGQIVFCQGLPLARPGETGMSAYQLDRIKPAMKKFIREDKLPGIVTLVARGGKIVYSGKCGVMDVDKPMKADAIFRIASMTKPVTIYDSMAVSGTTANHRITKSCIENILRLINFYKKS